MDTQFIKVAICQYPGALNSAVYGLEELFSMANRACDEQNLAVRFEPQIYRTESLPSESQHIVLLPPSGDEQHYLNPPSKLLEWLRQQHQAGATVASACAGAFILNASGVVAKRCVTTHWGLAELFQSHFRDTPLDTREILIDHGDVITAGGLMSWLDLGLELVCRYASLSVMRQLGKILVIDTAPREQRYYRQFLPNVNHGDKPILQSQQYVNQHYAQVLVVSELASRANLTERTFQRRFLKATGFNPNAYIQQLRVQKACDLLESSNDSFERIAMLVGYEDVSACRKVFTKLMGLSPKAFRMRFSREPQID
ncbi:helix-turn-helix domain-containing protein [Vibrio sp. SCSIO 43136]|uniref:GlxA family transcriptional regulator n=1 Tax=Vibrio sp. SCSIO 43136 TaxID=2819101 RepID=UPI002076162A|nr:helix-turn-helix domain-containing protein [Vibrio sp. SCSIO 43136]USD67531.1 helix-turn-helix domain-containing protein [Vibrio sp. SCSIO 43136]